MLNIFQKLITKKYVLLVGDAGAKLTYFHNGHPISSVQVNGVDAENIDELKELLLKHSRVPVYILADASEQSFKTIVIPSTNPLVVKKLLQRRIARDFKDSLNNYYSYKSAEDIEKGSSHYIIVSLSSVPPLSEWLDYLYKLKVSLEAVYSVPVEMQNISKEIELYLQKHNRFVPKSRWKMLVIYNRLGGFRIIVTKDSQIIFSRMLSFEGDDMNKVHAETLRNQVYGTVEYLRRIGYKDRHGINIFPIFPKEFNEVFTEETNKSYNIIHFSQSDFINIIYGRDAKKYGNDSIEQTLSTFFVKHGRYVTFFTKELEHASRMTNLNVGLSLASIFGSFFLLIFFLFNSQSVGKIKSRIEKNKVKIESLNVRLERIRQEKFGFDVDEDKVIASAKLNEVLLKEKYDPLDIIIRLASIKPRNIIITNYSWGLNENDKIDFKVNASFVGENISYEDLFSQYDLFIRDLRTVFKSYVVEHSELPDIINFNVNLDNVPITFKITGPNQ